MENHDLLSRSDSWELFPAGLKVLVVDDDPLCLKVVEHMLRRCNYQGVKPQPCDILRIYLRRDLNARVVSWGTPSWTHPACGAQELPVPSVHGLLAV